MPSDYAKISAYNLEEYGRGVSYYGSDFADRYTERTHFIFELLQNAEDALRWREGVEPRNRLPRSVKFVLFRDHLEVTHYGLPFNEDHVRAICSIKRGTKQQNLTDIGKFGIGFKSVYAYTKRPEVHSADEHFAIEAYVHPRATEARNNQRGETLFYIPFDHDEIPAEQAYTEISARLAKLGFRTLLFLSQIESVDWEIVGKAGGSYIRETKQRTDYKEVMLVGQVKVGDNARPLDEQHWLVFSRPITTPKGERAGQVEVAFKLAEIGKRSKRSIVKAEDSNLVVFFPTEKETHCGFLMQGPYKTTPSRDNIPHDNKWNNHLVKETAKLVSETFPQLADLKLASVGLLQAMPLLQSWDLPEDWMFRPVYDAVVETLKTQPLIPAAGGRLVSGRCARIARGKGLVPLFSPQQLTSLLGTDEDENLDWITPDISESRSNTSDLYSFLRTVLDVEQVEPEDLPLYMNEDFFQAQSITWMVKFYTFLLDHHRLWQREKPPGDLLEQPFIRLHDNRHVTPFLFDDTPNAYLPGDTDSDFDTIHPLLVKPKKCAQFLRKLGLTEPDLTSEVLEKIVPKYELSEIEHSDKNHHTNLRKIFRALSSESPNRSVLMERLKDLEFLRAVNPHKKQSGFRKPEEVYFQTKQLKTFFESHTQAWFLDEPEKLIGRNRIRDLLRELGVEDKPRRIRVKTRDDRKRQSELREGHGHSRDIHFFEYDIHGLGDFLKKVKTIELPEAVRRARLLWDFLLRHLEASPPARERSFFRGEYKWSHYKEYNREFDAHFLIVLRSKPWVPGRDRRLHIPSELLPQEMPSGFARHAILCDELRMKADVLVNLAKQAGFKVDDLTFIRQHREEFEKFKRSLKERPTPTATPLEETSPVVPAPTSASSPAGKPHPEAPRAQAAMPRPVDEAPSPQPPSQGEVAGAIDSILGSESGTPTAMPTDLDRPEFAPGADRSGTGSRGTDSSHGNVSAKPTSGPSKPSVARRQDGKHFTYVYVSPEDAEGRDESCDDDNSAEAQRREKVGREGVDFVMEWEIQGGRNPFEMPQTHEGYDIESRNPADRAIQLTYEFWRQLSMRRSGERQHQRARNSGEESCSRLLARAVAGQVGPLSGVEPFDCPHQANVAFANPIQQRHTNLFVVFGDLDHQQRVGLNHWIASFPFLSASRKL